MNKNYNYFYNHMYGDKETFRLSWKAALAPYYLVKFPFTAYGQIELLSDANGNSSVEEVRWRMCGVWTLGQRHPTSGKVIFMHNYKWHPMQLIGQGFSPLLRVAADNYSSLSQQKGCGPLHITTCPEPKDPQVRLLEGKEAEFESRGRQLLRQLWDTPTYQDYFCSFHPDSCQALRLELGRTPS